MHTCTQARETYLIYRRTHTCAHTETHLSRDLLAAARLRTHYSRGARLHTVHDDVSDVRNRDLNDKGVMQMTAGSTDADSQHLVTGHTRHG
jgi:hypothetical protein